MMTSVDLTRNFFEVFDIPVSFNVELSKLAEKYRLLQHAIHPDKYASGTDQEKRLSVQQSAYINEGYQTLKHPLTRAKYLLTLKGVDIGADNQTSMAPEFLMQQMELREALANVKESASPADEMARLDDEISQSTSALVREIASLFESNDSSKLDAIGDYVQRLQFMVKLGEEIESLEEELL